MKDHVPTVDSLMKNIDNSDHFKRKNTLIIYTPSIPDVNEHRLETSNPKQKSGPIRHIRVFCLFDVV